MASEPTKKNLKGTFQKEIDYLVSKGYRVSDDGATMVKE